MAVAVTSNSLIVKAVPIEGFASMSIEDATKNVYERVIMACEDKGVLLSNYGNHLGTGSIANRAAYVEARKTQSLFDIRRIQKAVGQVLTLFTPHSRYSDHLSSYALKHTVEKATGEYISNGDLIVAMLINGFDARFAKRGECIGVNGHFKVNLRGE
ncbi:MAG: hypothetical protein K9M07_06140 [Simkaniaceae bacterium]|nr:hypothetical protein [Simkaniaceae bacterium]MCF7852802.1 hypothetical protein [Simkaniaceae bacterium]